MPKLAVLPFLLVLGLVCAVCAGGAQSTLTEGSREQIPSSARGSKGQLQRFDYSFVLEPGGHRHFCEPAELGRLVSAAKTVAVTQGNVPPGEDATPLLNAYVDTAPVVRLVLWLRVGHRWVSGPFSFRK